jgi:AraC-like DNA-binding protein
VIDYFPQGHGEIRIEGRLYTFSAGDIILLSPAELHLCTIAEDVPFERITIHVSEEILEPFGGDRKDFFAAFYGRERGVGNLIRAERVRACGIDRMMREILSHAKSKRDTDKVLLRCKTVELLASLGKLVDGQKPSDESPRIENDLILEILQYLNAHYREPLSLSEISRVFYHSKYHVCHLFHEHVGLSIHDYLSIRRIHLVNDEIRKGRTVADACYAAGFHNYSNFFRLYKKHTGLTPQQFKQSLSNKQT